TAIAERLLGAAHRVRTTISVGVALLDHHDPHTIRSAADQLLYEAKSAGRDQARMADLKKRGDTVSA
ncbi:MAG: diguanylate cyclase, partial [Nocardioidaceae bacterium]|nr:diguanylate cyclase [Nocardioidaceae bacterium]